MSNNSQCSYDANRVYTVSDLIADNTQATWPQQASRISKSEQTIPCENKDHDHRSAKYTPDAYVASLAAQLYDMVQLCSFDHKKTLSEASEAAGKAAIAESGLVSDAQTAMLRQAVKVGHEVKAFFWPDDDETHSDGATAAGSQAAEGSQEGEESGGGLKAGSESNLSVSDGDEMEELCKELDIDPDMIDHCQTDKARRDTVRAWETMLVQARLERSNCTSDQGTTLLDGLKGLTEDLKAKLAPPLA
jgi:hypothetical protein